jgi:hypothetical protein
MEEELRAVEERDRQNDRQYRNRAAVASTGACFRDVLLLAFAIPGTPEQIFMHDFFALMQEESDCIGDSIELKSRVLLAIFSREGYTSARIVLNSMPRA